MAKSFLLGVVQLGQMPTTKTFDVIRINVAALKADEAKLTLSPMRALSFSKNPSK
jgi:hypothetical protein